MKTATYSKLMGLTLISFCIGGMQAHGMGNNSDGSDAVFSSANEISVALAGSATPLWESKSADGKKWSEYALAQMDSLGTHLEDVVPSDASTFCPNYANLGVNDRKAFWVYLMSAMTKYESNFDPTTKYTEAFADNSGNKVVSRGLLQISIESSQGYACGVTVATQLADPYVNLSCGIRILDHWMAKDARIAGKVSGSWRGGARYWSTLRSSLSPYSKIVALTNSISICKK